MRRKWWLIPTVAVCTLLLFASSLLCMRWCAQTYILSDWRVIRRDTEVLDLSQKRVRDFRGLDRLSRLQQLDLRGTGLTVEDYAYLHSHLPNCQILWELPFQGAYYPLDTLTIRVESLTDADVDALDYLTGLAHVDAMACTDYAQLMELQERHPACSVLYRVDLGDSDCLNDAEKLELRDTSAAELTEKLPLLPEVKAVHLTGDLPTPEELETVQRSFPEIRFSWTVKVYSEDVEMNAQRLDLTGTDMAPEQVEELMRYFPKLKTVDLRGSTMTPEQMMAMADRNPKKFFLWEMEVGPLLVSTDVEEMDFSGVPITDTAFIEDVLPYFQKLKKVIMCGCGLDNETMDALNRRHKDVLFVWTVVTGPVTVRTDAIYFMPTKWGVKVNDDDLYNLRYCTEMICVDIGHNKVTGCEWAAYMPHLKYLVIADSHLMDISPLAGHKELVFLELFMSRVKDYSPLVSCTALEDLNLCYTYGEPEPIKQMTWLKRLWWTGNWKASYYLPECLPDTETEFRTFSSTGAGWREGQRYYEMRDILGMPYMVG